MLRHESCTSLLPQFSATLCPRFGAALYPRFGAVRCVLSPVLRCITAQGEKEKRKKGKGKREKKKRERKKGKRYKKREPGDFSSNSPLGGDYLLSHFRSTIGVVRLNFSVRNGKRWDPALRRALKSCKSCKAWRHTTLCHCCDRGARLGVLLLFFWGALRHPGKSSGD